MLELTDGEELVVEKVFHVGPNWTYVAKDDKAATPITFGIRLMSTVDGDNADGFKDLRASDGFRKFVAYIKGDVKFKDKAGNVVTDRAAQVEIAARTVPIWLTNAIAKVWQEKSILSEEVAGNSDAR